MRAAVMFAAGAVALAISVPVSAQDFKLQADLFGQKKPASKLPPIDWSRGPAAEQNAPAKPSVVCGMTVIPADPKFDAKMRVLTPDTGIAFAMRVVEPVICKAP